MRGPQNLCYDTLDNPEFIKAGVMNLFSDFKKMYDELCQLTTKYHDRAQK